MVQNHRTVITQQPPLHQIFSTNIPVEEEQEQEANGDKPAQEFLFFCPSHLMWKKNEPVLKSTVIVTLQR